MIFIKGERIFITKFIEKWNHNMLTIMYIAWDNYQCEVQYDNEVEKWQQYFQNVNALLGKGKVSLHRNMTEKASTNFKLLYSEQERFQLELEGNTVYFSTSWSEIKRSQMLDCILLSIFINKLYSDGIACLR